MGYEAWEPDAGERAFADPRWGMCACCDSETHWSEFADDCDEVADALAKAKGGPVCTTCAEDHMICACGSLTSFDDAWQDHDGAFHCDDCATCLPENITAARADDARKAAYGG